MTQAIPRSMNGLYNYYKNTDQGLANKFRGKNYEGWRIVGMICLVAGIGTATLLFSVGAGAGVVQQDPFFVHLALGVTSSIIAIGLISTAVWYCKKREHDQPLPIATINMMANRVIIDPTEEEYTQL